MSRRDQRVLCANSDTLEPALLGISSGYWVIPPAKGNRGGKRKGKKELQAKILKGSVMHDEV